MISINQTNIQSIIEKAENLRQENFTFDDLFKKPKDLQNNRNNCGKFYDIVLDENVEVLGKKCKNFILYPPYGGMGWHTNGPQLGKRIYISWSESGNSGMNWYNQEKDQIINDKDEAGFNIRIFDIPRWHCVWAKCYRLSIGFDIT